MSDDLDKDVARSVMAAFRVTDALALIVNDAQRRIVWANAAALDLFAARSLVGALSDELFTPEAREHGIPAHEMEVASRLGSARDDRWMQRQDGTRFWASGLLVAAPEGEEGGGQRHFVKVLRDFTEEAMRLQEARAGALHEGSSRVGQRLALAETAHEMRNPLSVIQASLQIAAHPEAGPSDRTESLQRIRGQVEFLDSLVQRMLESTRGEDRAALDITIVELSSLVSEAVLLASGGDTTQAKRVETVLAEPQVRFHTDRGRLIQVLVNLVENALKFTPPAGRIWLRASVVDADLIFRVRDEGPGIAPHLLEKIFDAFTRAATESDADGLGLGLAIARDQAAALGGSIQAKSLGPGAEFIVRIPYDTP